MDRAFSAQMVDGSFPGALPQAGMSPRLWRYTDAGAENGARGRVRSPFDFGGSISVFTTPSPIPAVPEGHLRIAQHFSAGSGMGRYQVPTGTAAPRATGSVVPAGRADGINAYPALKCWAILGRPCGTARTVPRRCKKLKCTRLCVGLKKISTERHFFLAFGSANKEKHTTPMAKLGPYQSSRRPDPLAVPSFSQSRPSRTLTVAVPPVPTARRCAPKNRFATHIRAVATARTVFAPTFAPTVPTATVADAIFAPWCPRGPFSRPYSRRYALADRLRPPSPRHCDPTNGRGPHICAVAPQKTIFHPIFFPLSHLKPTCYINFHQPGSAVPIPRSPFIIHNS